MRGVQVPSPPSLATDHRGWAAALLAPAAATTVVYTPELLLRPDQWLEVSGYVAPAWLALLVLVAPMTAALTNRRRPFATTTARACLVGLPQLPLAFALMRLGIWLDVRSGYLSTSDAEMALEWGIILASFMGLLLTTLVAAAARLGASRHPS